MDNQLVTLTFPNHHRTLTDGLCRLLADQRGVDCRLTWGGRSLPAHRLMVDIFLSAAVDQVHYEMHDLNIKFDTLSGNHAGQNDCPIKPLESIMDFMYRGRTIVPQSELDLFLDAAKALNFDVLSQAVAKVRGTCSERPSRRTRGFTKVATDSSNPQSEEETVTDGRTKSIEMETNRISDIVAAPDLVSGATEEEFPASKKRGRRSVAEKVVNRCLDTEQSLPPTNLKNKGNKKLSIRIDVTSKGSQDSVLPVLTNIKSGRRLVGKSGADMSADSPVPSDSVQPIKPKCSACHKSFADETSLAAHRCLHSGSSGIHECPHCPYKSRVRIWYQIHLAKHDPSVQLFRCGSCTRKFLTDDELAHHQSSHVGGTSPQLHQCPHCQRQLRSRASYKLHVARHDPTVKVHRCDDCGQTFFARESLLRHQLAHKPYTCAHCDYVTRKIWSYYAHLFARHQLNAKGETVSRLRCDQCDTFTCKTAGRLRCHLLAKHSDSPPFRCGREGCQFTSGYKGDVRNHVKAVHLKIRAHLCQECGTRWVSRSALERHLLSHSGARGFTCDVCGQAYRYLSTLRAHARRHGPQQYERPFVCQVCSHAFDRRHNLKVHLRNVHKVEGEAVQPHGVVSSDRVAGSEVTLASSVAGSSAGDHQ